MPVCIVGMHRSGTSMVARALNLCGLNLGDDLLTEDRLADLPGVHLKPGDNPEGYWEHVGFLTCNLDILQILFGSIVDRYPLEFPAGWIHDPRLTPVRERALKLAESMGMVWGWKDPRNTITLPFWQDVFPDLKVVVCVRNPLEVAQSLVRRGDITWEESLTFWRYYHERLAEALPNSPYIVTHMDSYYYDGAAEIARVAAFVELDGSKAQEAAESIKAEGHRNVMSEKLLEKEVAINQQYAFLCGQAGDVFVRVNADLDFQQNLARQSRHFFQSRRLRTLYHALVPLRARLILRDVRVKLWPRSLNV